MTEEDALDAYRQDVERRVAGWIAGASDEDLEPFFEHVMAQFAQGVTSAFCAWTWLDTVSRERRSSAGSSNE